MQAMKEFSLWLLDNIPTFFMSEPIIYIFGCILLSFVISIILRLCRYK